MDKFKRFFNGLALIIVIFLVSYGLYIFDYNAWADCSYSFVAEAQGSGDLRFQWIGTENGVVQFDFPEVAGQISSSFHQPGSNILLTEIPPSGWEVAEISCIGEGFAFEILSENSVIMTCVDDSTVGTCTFLNVRLPSDIPTLSEWGLIAMAGVLGIIGIWAVRRKLVA